MNNHWVSNGQPLDFEWTTIGFGLDNDWISIGQPLDSIGQPLDLDWTTIGLGLDNQWISIGQELSISMAVGIISEHYQMTFGLRIYKFIVSSPQDQVIGFQGQMP